MEEDHEKECELLRIEFQKEILKQHKKLKNLQAQRKNLLKAKRTFLNSIQRQIQLVEKQINEAEETIEANVACNRLLDVDTEDSD